MFEQRKDEPELQITRAVRAFVLPGAVLEGELVVWEHGRTNFALLQRWVTAGRQLLREAREHPAYYVTFDLLVDAGGERVLDAPLVERRARLLRLLAGGPPQLAVTPQSADVSEVSERPTSHQDGMIRRARKVSNKSWKDRVESW